MSDLGMIFHSLCTHHIARAGAGLPDPVPGISWIWAKNGIFKRGVNANLDLLVLIAPTAPTPGLAPLMPHVRWRQRSGRLPGQLLHAMLLHARRAASISAGIARPIEQQYHITHADGALRVRVPPQQATAARVTYTVPNEPVLLDLHSHHEMPAFFSSTDDCDDQGLSVSAVIGTIFSKPTITLRLNVYGHRQIIPALGVFDSLGAFHEVRGQHAHAHD